MNWLEHGRVAALRVEVRRGRDAAGWLTTAGGGAGTGDQAITLARMAARDEKDLLQRARAGFFQALMAADLTEDEARTQATALGLSDASVYVPVAVHVSPLPGGELTQLQLRERALLEECLAAAHPLARSVIGVSLRTGSFALLVGLGVQSDIDPVLRRMVTGVRAKLEWRGRRQPEEADRSWTVGVGRAQEQLTAGANGVQEAAQVAQAAATMEIRRKLYYRLSDVRLRGLVAVLADDPRVRAFAEAELGPLLAGRPTWGLELLELYLRHGGNKSAVARAGHVSRQALYARLQQLESILGVSLDDPESRTALHVAIQWVRHSMPSE